MRSFVLFFAFGSLLLIACSFDKAGISESSSITCGDDVADQGEECDGTDIPSSCASMGFAGGTIGCTSSCTLDTTSCIPFCGECTVGEAQCSGDQLLFCAADTEECGEWVLEEDCTLSGAVCSEASGSPQCEVQCTDQCTLDQMRCDGDNAAIETCVTGESGCTQWEQSQACPPDTICRGEDEHAECLPCLACSLGSRRCADSADGIEECQEDVHSCTGWVLVESCDTGQLMGCTDDGSGPLCNPQGDTCVDAPVVQLPYHLELQSLSEYTDTVYYTAYSCGTNTYGSTDLFLMASLTGGTRVHFYEESSTNVDLTIDNDCNSSTCLGTDSNTQEISFDVPSDGTYVFIVETTSGDGALSLHIEEVPELCTHTELEPNNSVAEADDFGVTPDFYCHSIPEGSDSDCVVIAVGGTGGSLRAETGSGYDLTTCPGDTQLELFTSYGAPLFEDDDSGTGYCSLMDHTTDPEVRYLPPGQYILCDSTPYSYQTIPEKIAAAVTVSPATWDLILFQDFESGTFPPAGWTRQTQGTTTTAGWQEVPMGLNHKAQVLTSDPETGVGYGLHTPAVDLSIYSEGVLQLVTTHNCGSSNTPYIYYTTDGWASMYELWSTTVTTSPEQLIQLPLPPGIVGHPSVEFAFVVLDNYNYANCQWSIDDILIAAW